MLQHTNRRGRNEDRRMFELRKQNFLLLILAASYITANSYYIHFSKPGFTVHFSLLSFNVIRGRTFRLYCISTISKLKNRRRENLLQPVCQFNIKSSRQVTLVVATTAVFREAPEC